MLISSMRRLPRLSLVFKGVSVFFGLRYYRVGNLLVTVETGKITQVFASRTSYVTGISPLVFKSTLLLFLSPKAFLRRLASRILG